MKGVASKPASASLFRSQRSTPVPLSATRSRFNSRSISISILLSLFVSLSLSLSLVQSASSQSESSEVALQEYIICRQCGTDIADSYYIETQKSPSATVYSNITLFGKSGVDLQVLINPIGIRFKIINTPKALCSGVGDWVPADSWYPGFLWKFCVCPQCSTHLGWIFEPTLTATTDRINPSDKGFYAIIVDNVLSEKLVQSLMVSPDLFHS